jgi:putative ABC transport system permease protein
MLDLDAWQEIWSTLERNKLRATLTACGVFWGIFMLVLMLGIGVGLERGVHENLMGYARRSVFLWSQSTSLPYAGLPTGRPLRFENADGRALSGLAGVEHVAPRVQLAPTRQGNNVTHAKAGGTFNIMGDVPELLHIHSFSVLSGRFLNHEDLRQERKVIVIGDKVRKVLFPSEQEVIGQYVQVQGKNFQVVGEVSAARGGDEGEKLGSTLYLPISTLQRAFNQHDRVGWFALTLRADSSAPQIEERARQLLASRHRVHPADPQAIASFNAAEEVAKVEQLFHGIRWFVWCVGVLTLIAGVLGVSNILLIIVKERTKEIGIRKALGATPRAIVGLIVSEALLLTALAGYAGLVAGVIVLELVGNTVEGMPSAPLNRPEIDLPAALLATVVLLVAGLVASVVPARRAAGIQPVEALRAE